MQPSIHFYVLSLSDQKTRLYEGFRDKLIDIQNKNFPLEISINVDNPTSPEAQLRDFFSQTDKHFSRYYKQDPLPLVIVGEKSNLDLFIDLTKHRDTILGTVKGNYNTTSSHDLGKIVWPVVKKVISGATKTAMSNLATAAKQDKVVSGIDAVGQASETKVGSTLYVEENYHLKGSIRKTQRSLIISKHVNIWEAIDDVVDLIIERVLKMGGNVIFLENGALVEFERIALILPN